MWPEGNETVTLVKWRGSRRQLCLPRVWMTAGWKGEYGFLSFQRFNSRDICYVTLSGRLGARKGITSSSPRQAEAFSVLSSLQTRTLHLFSSVMLYFEFTSGVTAVAPLLGDNGSKISQIPHTDIVNEFIHEVNSIPSCKYHNWRQFEKVLAV